VLERKESSRGGVLPCPPPKVFLVCWEKSVGQNRSEETEQGQSDYLQPQLVNGLHALRQKIAIEPDAGLFRVADGGNYEGWWYADAQLGNLAQLRSLYSQSCW